MQLRPSIDYMRYSEQERSVTAQHIPVEITGRVADGADVSAADVSLEIHSVSTPTTTASHTHTHTSWSSI